MSRSGNFNPSIRFTVVSVFAFATSLTAVLAIGLQFYFGHALAKEAARDLYTLASQSVASEIDGIRDRTTNIIELLAENPVLGSGNEEALQRKVFASIMEKNALFYGVYLGHGDGSFFELINLDASEATRKSLRALPTDRWLVSHVYGEGRDRQRHFSYYDDSFNLRLERSEPTDYDVRTRSWYSKAMVSGTAYRSDPYLFALSGQSGQTVSRRLGDSDTVIGIDMTLNSISGFLAKSRVAELGEVFLYSADGEIIASSASSEDSAVKLPVPQFTMTSAEKAFVASQPTLKVSNEMNWPPFDYAVGGEPRGYSVDVIRLISEMTGLQFQFINGHSWAELISLFAAGELDVVQSVVPNPENIKWGLVSDSYADVPHALATTEAATKLTSMEQLVGKTLAIPIGWSIIPVVREYFPGVTIVETASTLQALRKVLNGEVDAALDNEVMLRHVASHYFLNGLAYHSDPDFGEAPVADTLKIMTSRGNPQLLELINRALSTIGVTQRDYLVQKWLDFEGLNNQSGGGGVPSEVLVSMTSDPSLMNKLIETQSDGQTFFAYGTRIASADEQPLFFGVHVPEVAIVGPFMEKVKWSIGITAGFLGLLLPLSWAFASPIVRPIKQLALQNDKVRDRMYDEVQQVTSNIKELDELSESMVEMVGAIRSHEQAQRELMDSFIQLIAQAIDDKSAYTGGHCERVPVLALMLAEEASSTDMPAFSSFRLDTDDQWREYKIAAWLHDCGKITTPEHIVDKGSKLETIYNRIHEVRMRFEVLHRDAEIDYWEQLSKHPEQREALTLQLKTQQAALQDDYTFIANCNVGGEFLDPQKQERLNSLGQTVWQRYFDDRLGLSPVEELRVEGQAEALPARELLLADKSAHIISRTSSTDYPPEMGINMDVPEHLYNLGELYNLSISRGTLTAEDRFKINEHMISTIKMLGSLPFPPELQNVPRYASTHHETMRGSGYPRKLSGEQLSIPERILAVADIFEALTASDRPYKKAKPVSVALRILYKMMLDNHVDKDCFELFVRSGVYQKYAEEFLQTEQIDRVDITEYLS
jgi:HD-GYP domain-containing protein (c-di-GMP phosphodiesterase class II)/ABC-type amino acid transport substrate-binding protein